MATKYSYSIASDFTGSAVASDKLAAEIAASSIVTAIDRIETTGDVCDIWFVSALSAGDKTTLDNDTTGPSGGLVGAHDGVAPADVSESYLSSEGESATTSDAYQEKLTYAPAWLMAGDYDLEWSVEMKSADVGTPVKLRIQVDDTTTIAEVDFHPDTANGAGWGAQSGFGRVTVTDGAHNFDFDYASSEAAMSVSIRRVRLKVRKV